MSVQFVLRHSNERGNADYGWLRTFHSFATAMYYSPEHEKWGCLRVFNEDRVDAHTGFDTHGHREFEIFSYVVSGELEHTDSTGSHEVLKRGGLQMTSAGTGVRHSEHAHGDKEVYFLQIWVQPSQRGLKPQYFTRNFSDEEKKDKWVTIVAPVGTEGVVEKRETTGPAPIHSPLTCYASLISPSTTLSHILPAGTSSSQRLGFIHVVQKSGYNPGKPDGAHIKLSSTSGNTIELREGDAAYITGDAGVSYDVHNVGDRVAEVILFDLE